MYSADFGASHDLYVLRIGPPQRGCRQKRGCIPGHAHAWWKVQVTCEILIHPYSCGLCHFLWIAGRLHSSPGCREKQCLCSVLDRIVLGCIHRNARPVGDVGQEWVLSSGNHPCETITALLCTAAMLPVSRWGDSQSFISLHGKSDLLPRMIAARSNRVTASHSSSQFSEMYICHSATRRRCVYLNEPQTALHDR